MIPVDAALFARGLAGGAAIAAPVGPMSLLCMRRTLVQGWRFGMGTGAGIACGDGLYALVAAFGLASVMHFMLAHERPLHFAAGALLVWIGWRTFFARPSGVPREPAKAPSVGAAWGSALLLTLTNPPTILAFVAVFTALVPSGLDVLGALVLVGGVFTGSLLWWLLLTLLVAVARHALGTRIRRWIDRVSGAILGIFGAAELRRAI